MKELYGTDSSINMKARKIDITSRHLAPPPPQGISRGFQILILPASIFCSSLPPLAQLLDTHPYSSSSPCAPPLIILPSPLSPPALRHHFTAHSSNRQITLPCPSDCLGLTDFMLYRCTRLGPPYYVCLRVG